MVSSGHASVGALIGFAIVKTVPASAHPFLIIITAFLAAILSHYVCDFVPHGHYFILLKKLTTRSMTILFFDTFGATALILLLALLAFGLSPSFFIIAAAIIGAQLPDAFEGLVDLKIIPTGRFSKIHRYWHFKIIHWHNEPTSKLPGHGRPIRWTDLWQLITFMLAILVLLRVQAGKRAVMKLVKKKPPFWRSLVDTIRHHYRLRRYSQKCFSCGKSIPIPIDLLLPRPSCPHCQEKEGIRAAED